MDRARTRALLPRALLSLALTPRLSASDVDTDTPLDAYTQLSLHDAAPHTLVFSDEFEAAGRPFADGSDPRWTALRGKPRSNEQLNYYMPELVGTRGGRLELNFSTERVEFPTFDPSAPTAAAFFQTGYVESWSKVCFTGGGIVEVRARLPGAAAQGGLWPAFWLFGNLGRATFEDSTSGLWPFTFDEHDCVDTSHPDCEANQCDAMRINACDPAPPFGLNPYQARGAPEIDVLEVQAGSYALDYGKTFNAPEYDCEVPSALTVAAVAMRQPFISTSLQSAPGFPADADQRPKGGCVPRNYTFFPNQTAAPQTREQWYPQLSPEWVDTFSSSYHKVSVNYFFWGDLYDRYGWDPARPTSLQTDAYSANSELFETHFRAFHTYQVEWRAGPQGFVAWAIDGVRVFFVGQEVLQPHRQVSVGGRPRGKLHSRQVPAEPMYMILNVDLSPKWGWPVDPAGVSCGGCERAEQFDCSNANCTHCAANGTGGARNVRAWFATLCASLPNSSYSIDWVRAYQRAGGGQSVGCDPSSHPTKRWVAGHAAAYRRANESVLLRAVVAGGASCAADAECSPPAGQCVDGACACVRGRTGPRCLAQEAAAAARCRQFDDESRERNGTRCKPPAAYNTTWLNLLLRFTCENATGASLAAACAAVGASPRVLADCARLEGTADWTACAEYLGGGCAAYGRAAHVLHAGAQASRGGGVCCNSFYFTSAGAPRLSCTALPAASPPGPLANLDSAAQGVLYAPFAPGADPRKADDLYTDANGGTFRRDARVLHALGATTLVLEPWLEDTYHTQLFDAMRFEAPPGMGLLEQEEARERATWDRINLVPTMAISADELNLFTGLTAETMIDAVCERATRLVRYALTPEYGRPADSKLGVQAFNIDLQPNNKRKWTAPSGYTPWLDVAMQPEWNSFLIMQRIARCTKDAQQPFQAEHHTLPLPVLVTIVDDKMASVTDLGATVEGFLDLYRAYLTQAGESPSVDGFIVLVSRAHGCSVESMTRRALQSASLFGELSFQTFLQMWFSIGVDAYNDAARAPYLTTRQADEPEFMDARTACLLQVLHSVNDGCEGYTPRCGVVVQEYADSFWRARYAGATQSANALRQKCPADSENEQTVNAIATSPTHRVCGDFMACASLACNLASFSMGNASVPSKRRLPSYLRCSNDGVDSPLCPPAAPLAIDDWFNVAWDGLMEHPPPEGAYGCTGDDFVTETALRPRRAFYFIQKLWATRQPGFGAAETSVPWEWPQYISSVSSNEASEGRFMQHPVGWFCFWLVFFILGLAFTRALLAHTGVAGRWSVGLTLVGALILNSLPHDSAPPLPCLIRSCLWELMLIVLFVVFWFPLNGGAGEGSWWWVHLVVFYCVLTIMPAPLADLSNSECTQRVGPMAMLLFQLLRFVLPLPTADANVPPPWDVCKAGTCCQVNPNATGSHFFPWSPTVVIPDAWEPFLPWYVVFQLLGLSFVLVLGALGLGACTLQLLWVFSPQGTAFFSRWRSKQRIRKLMQVPSLHSPADCEVDPVLELDGLRAIIRSARAAIAAMLGDHFQHSSYENTEAQLLCLIESRARRLHGGSFYDGPMTDVKATLVRACGVLSPPHGITRSAVGDLWRDLTINTREWMPPSGFPPHGPRSTVYTLLSRRGATVQQALDRGVSGDCFDLHLSEEFALGLWEAAFLMLLVTAEGWMRATPDCASFLFAAYACAIVDARIERQSDNEGTWLGVVQNLTDLSNLRSGLYELHKRAGGTLGNRIPDVLSEKYMLFDDIDELCAAPRLPILLSLTHLSRFLEEETQALIKWGLHVGAMLCSPDSQLQVAANNLGLAFKLFLRYRNLGRQYETLDSSDAESTSSQRPPNAVDGSEVTSSFRGTVLFASTKSAEDQSIRHRVVPVEAIEMEILRETIPRDKTNRKLLHNNTEESAQDISNIVHDAVASLLREMSLCGLTAVARAAYEDVPFEKGVVALLESLKTLLNATNSKEDSRSPEVGRMSQNSAGAAQAFDLQASLNDLNKQLQGLRVDGTQETRSHSTVSKQQEDAPDTSETPVIGNYCVTDIAALASLSNAAREVLKKAALGPCLDDVGCRERFTWGSDQHKTFEERRGYDFFALETWFLWSVLILIYCGTLAHESGGYFLWLVGYAMSETLGGPASFMVQAAEWLDEKIIQKVGLESWLKSSLGEGYAPNWIRYYLMLGVLHHLLRTVANILQLRRSISADSQREHAYWALGRRLLWHVSRSETSGLNQIHESKHFNRYRPQASSSRGHFLLAFWREFAALGKPLCLLMSFVLYIPLTLISYVLQLKVFQISVWKAIPLLLVISGRCFFLVVISMLYNGIESNYNGLGLGETFDTSSGRAFALIMFTLGWWDVLTSIAQSVVRLLPSMPALFGWYYELYKNEWLQSIRTESRTVKRLVVSSCFWVLVFSLKILFAFTQLHKFTSTMYKLCDFEDMSASGMISAAVTLILRGVFSVLFFVADLQVFFAGVLGAFGGVTAAVMSLFRKLGSLWDRYDVTSDQLRAVAAGLMQTFTPIVGMHYEGLQTSLTPENQEADLLSRLWNDGFLQDLKESNQLSQKMVDALRIVRDPAGNALLPDIKGVTPLICSEAKRRIHAFCSFAKRSVDVPTGSMPVHMPALTVLVPVYGETFIRSWHQMFDKTASKLTNLEFLVESHIGEFGNFLEYLPPEERDILKPHTALDVRSEEILGLCDVMGLRDKLWFSEHLLTVAKFGGASSGEKIDKAALKVSQIMLRGAALMCGGVEVHPSAPATFDLALLNELPSRIRAAEDAANLGLPCIDEVVESLYKANVGGQASWASITNFILRKSPDVDETRRDRALLALGVSKSHDWKPEDATYLCREIFRSFIEARTKLRLRLWFSLREQTVWRTLSGLGKGKAALQLLQEICNEALQGAAYRDGIDPPHPAQLPHDLFKVMAALQNYAGWRSGRASLARSCESMLAELTKNESDLAQHSATLSSLIKNMYDPNRLVALHDQCCATALLLRRYPFMEISYLQSLSGGRWSSILCGGQSNGDHLASEPIADPCAMIGQLYTHRKIMLPGNPIADALAEGKPANQANAMLHVTCELLMVNDCNQGADLEQWFFLPRLLNEFHTDIAGRPVRNKGVRIVGFRENIFTESGGVVARSGALNEHVFGTIIQRQLQKTLNARLHYGHPDIFDFGFVLAQGGTSKMSKSVNVSEDIFGGINVFRRGGKINYGDYFQIDKGRDVQYDAALDFEGKIACGTSMHAHSRDFHRLMTSPLSWFHKVSLFSGSLGLFISNSCIVSAIFVLTCMHAVAAMLPQKTQTSLYYSFPSYSISLLNLGFIYVFALAVQVTDERGVRATLEALITVFLAIPLTLCKMCTHKHYVHRGLALGVARYMPTGRDLATKRVGFRTIFMRYSQTHLSMALEMMMLLIIFGQYTKLGNDFYLNTSFTSWLVAASWLSGPAIYNPYAFTLDGFKDDYKSWTEWSGSPTFHEWRLGGRENGKPVVSFVQSNWFTWLNLEPSVLRMLSAMFKLTMYFGLSLGVATNSYGHQGRSHVLIDRFPTQLTVIILAGAFLYAAQVRLVLLRLIVSYAAASLVMSTILGGYAIPVFLFLWCALKACAAVLEAVLIPWSVFPWKINSAHPASGYSSTVASIDRIIWPQHLLLLTCHATRFVAKVHADLQALLYLAFTGFCTLVALVPVAFLAVIGLIWGVLILVLDVTFEARVDIWRQLLYVVAFIFPAFLAWYLFEGRLKLRQSQGDGQHTAPSLADIIPRVTFGTLHNCFVMNGAVARAIVEIECS